MLIFGRGWFCGVQDVVADGVEVDGEELAEAISQVTIAER